MPRPVFGKISAAAQSETNRKSNMAVITLLSFSGMENQNFSRRAANRHSQRAPAIPIPRAEVRQI